MTDEKGAAPADMTVEQYERLQPVARTRHGDVEMAFAVPSRTTLYRVETIRQKEPWTLEWIASFQPGDVLVDCGANVGMYTIWAAATRQARVYAFEPEAQNYALLNRNILLNRLGDRAAAFCLGLSDTSGLSQLHLSELLAGGSCHAVGEELNFSLKPFTPAFSQGCVVARLDDLVEAGSIPVPKHIKIDVDGFEHRVIAGARATLARPAVESVLIELNSSLPEHRGVIDQLLAHGFAYDEAQVARATRQAGSFKGVAEHIFRR